MSSVTPSSPFSFCTCKSHVSPNPSLTFAYHALVLQRRSDCQCIRDSKATSQGQWRSAVLLINIVLRTRFESCHSTNPVFFNSLRSLFNKRWTDRHVVQAQEEQEQGHFRWAPSIDLVFLSVVITSQNVFCVSGSCTWCASDVFKH